MGVVDRTCIKNATVTPECWVCIQSPVWSLGNTLRDYDFCLNVIKKHTVPEVTVDFECIKPEKELPLT